MNYRCPCCRNLTFDDEPPGTYEVCPVCGWEDDPVQFKDETYAGGANKVSLVQARKNYAEHGACDDFSAKDPRPRSEHEKRV